MTSLKSPSASPSLAFDGSAAEVLQSGCHQPQSSSWRAHQLYFWVCWKKTNHLGTCRMPGRAAPQLLETWNCGALEIWADTPQLGCLWRGQCPENVGNCDIPIVFYILVWVFHFLSPLKNVSKAEIVPQSWFPSLLALCPLSAPFIHPQHQNLLPSWFLCPYTRISPCCLQLWDWELEKETTLC